MAVRTYILVGVPSASKNAAKQALNAIMGLPSTGDWFTAPYSGDGSFPATWEVSGWWIDDVGMAANIQNAVSNPVANLPTPGGGWPFGDVSQVAARAAAALMSVHVITEEEEANTPAVTRNAFKAAKNVTECSDF